MGRDAVDTIRGYCYQFDKAIFEVLNLPALDDYIEVESIEDVDVNKSGTYTAFQCKYYENTDYNHSIIAKPLRLMLSHFKANSNFTGNYYLHGHYKSGHAKLTLPITIDFLKSTFLTYSEKKVQRQHHTELNISDQELDAFIKKLTINIHAKSFEKQQEEIISKMIDLFKCSKEEAYHYYYSNAFNVINKLACNKKSRKISKKDFITAINKKYLLFNIWLYEYKGKAAYLRELKARFMPAKINLSPYARFFLLELLHDTNMNEIKQCIYKIQEKWSNLSKRNDTPFSPFIYLYGVDDNFLLSLKNELYNEGLFFCDGHPYKNSAFKVDRIMRNFEERNIKFQFIDSIDSLNEVINNIRRRVELYCFYQCNSIELPTNHYHLSIQIREFSDILEIV